MMKNKIPTYEQGFSLLELLIVAIIVTLGTAWAIPQYRRQLALNQLDQYTQQIESGLFSLRARQSSEGTSCEINFNSNFVGTNNTKSGYGSPAELIEFSHLTDKQRAQRLECCDATQCEWDPPYRLIDQENTSVSRNVELKVSQASYSLSPPGSSTDENALVLLVRSTNWNQDPQRPLPLRCVRFSTAGHLHRGSWKQEKGRWRCLHKRHKPEETET